jgi:hypothetical protein
MAIKIDCPRCKTLLQVPRKLAGGYVNCPNCKGRLWVAKDAAAEATPSPLAPLPRAVPPVAGSSGSMPVLRAAPELAATAPAILPPGVPAPPPPPPPRKRVARFITADSADSRLLLAADGKLPELHLEEDGTQQKEQAGGRAMNPVVLFAILAASIVVSILLVWLGMAQSDATGSPQKDRARQMIETNYFGSGNIENRPLEPYQVLLRDADAAHSRGDYRTEQECYRRVLRMLRAERQTQEKGLTGSRSRDKQLDDALTVLLGKR